VIRNHKDADGQPLRAVRPCLVDVDSCHARPIRALLCPSVDVRPVTEFLYNTPAVLEQAQRTKRPFILKTARSERRSDRLAWGVQ